MMIVLGDDEEPTTKAPGSTAAPGAKSTAKKPSGAKAKPMKNGETVAKEAKKQAKEPRAAKASEVDDGAAEAQADDEAKQAKKAAKHAKKEAKRAEKEAEHVEKAARKAAKAEKKAAERADRGELESDDDGDKDDKKRKVSFESFLPRDEAVAYFEQVLAGLQEGTIELRQGEEGIALTPAAELEFELVATRSGKKERLTIEFSWRSDQKERALSIDS